MLARLKRLEEHYTAHGMRRTCEGILVCHEHNHPHILMLQIANAFFKLPGDYLRPDDDEIEGFKSRLDERLAPVGSLGEGGEGGRLAGWRLPRPVVAAKLRDLHVSLCSRTYYATEGVQEALLHSVA